MIEKTIHYFWIGDKPLGEKEKKCIASWKKYLPDYRIVEWNEKNYDFSYCQYIQDAKAQKRYGFAIDVARLDIVYRYGGIYLDTDVEIIRSFNDSLLCHPAICCFEGKKFVNFGSILGAEKENPVILKLLEQYMTRDFILHGGTLNLTTCSAYQAKDLKNFYGLKLNGKTQRLNGITVFSSDFFDPKNVETEEIKITENTYSIHHFEGTWLTPTAKKRHEIKKKLLINHRILGRFYATVYVFFSYLKHEGVKTVINKMKERF